MVGQHQCKLLPCVDIVQVKQSDVLNPQFCELEFFFVVVAFLAETIM